MWCAICNAGDEKFLLHCVPSCTPDCCFSHTACAETKERISKHNSSSFFTEPSQNSSTYYEFAVKPGCAQKNGGIAIENIVNSLHNATCQSRRAYRNAVLPRVCDTYRPHLGRSFAILTSALEVKRSKALTTHKSKTMQEFFFHPTRSETNIRPGWAGE